MAFARAESAVLSLSLSPLFYFDSVFVSRNEMKGMTYRVEITIAATNGNPPPPFPTRRVGSLWTRVVSFLSVLHRPLSFK